MTSEWTLITLLACGGAMVAVYMLGTALIEPSRAIVGPAVIVSHTSDQPSHEGAEALNETTIQPPHEGE